MLQVQIDELTKNTEGKNKGDIQRDLAGKITTLKDIEGRISQYKSQYKSNTGVDEITTDVIRQNLSDNRDAIRVLEDMDIKLRKLQANIDRQVVISTHDEIFFNLLKKKFNSEYYNSKFIEFEFYG